MSEGTSTERGQRAGVGGSASEGERAGGDSKDATGGRGAGAGDGGSHATPGTVTLRCGFCGTLNRVELARAADRPTCGKCQKPMLLDRPVKVHEEDFTKTVLGTQAPVLVDFYADWCGPCKWVAPLMDEIAREQEGRMLVAKVDTDRAQEVALEYGIRSIPTLVLFRDGKEVERSVGFEPDRVRELVRRAVA